MDIQQIITDQKLSPEAKVILVTAEIEKIIRAAPAEEVKINLMCEEVVFHTYRAAFVPRVSGNTGIPAAAYSSLRNIAIA